jgi:hypothetical protein
MKSENCESAGGTRGMIPGSSLPVFGRQHPSPAAAQVRLKARSQPSECGTKTCGGRLE